MSDLHVATRALVSVLLVLAGSYLVVLEEEEAEAEEEEEEETSLCLVLYRSGF